MEPDHSRRLSDSLILGFGLPVGERLRSGADIGDVGVDPAGTAGRPRPLGFFGAPGGLVFLLGDAGLLPLSFCDGGA